MTGLRIMLALAGVAAAMTLPPWVALIAVVALAAKWRAWEAPLIGLLIDSLWLPAGAPWSVVPTYTLVSLAIVWALEPLRARFL
jgi:hypothetical protein